MLNGIGFYVTGGVCIFLGLLSAFVFKEKKIEFEYRVRKDGTVIRIKKSKVPTLNEEQQKEIKGRLLVIKKVKLDKKEYTQKIAVFTKIIEDNALAKGPLTEDVKKAKDELEKLKLEL